MSNLRQAAQQALEVLENSRSLEPVDVDWVKGKRKAVIATLRAALAEEALQRLTDVQQEIEATLAEPNKCTHGVTDGNCKECYMADEQEPFAYCYVRKGTSVDILTFDDNPKDAVSGTVFPLYAAPPQRLPLTEEEIGKAWSVADGEHNASAAVKRRITRAIEHAHGIKGKA